MKKNLLKTLLFVALAGALPALAWAQKPDFGGRRPGGPPPGVHGRITAINSDSLAVERPDGTTQIVTINKETVFARNRQDATLGDLKVGDFVGIMGPRSEDGQVTAARVMAGDQPPPPPGERGPGGEGGPFGSRGPRPNPENSVHGKITAINGDLITVQTPDGATQVINVSGDAAISRNRAQAKTSDLKVGDFLGAMGKRNADGQFVPERIFASDKPRGGPGGPPPPDGKRPDGLP